jgi:tetratricopeptide (TPR) repeat protein
MGYTIVLAESDEPVGVLTRRAFELAGVPWDQCHHEDRGTLALVLVPSRHVLEKLPAAFARAAREAAQTRLRVSVHPQTQELTASAVDRAFRLLGDSRFVDLVTEAVDVGVVAPADAFAEEPPGAVVHRLTDARVFLLVRSPAAMDSAAETYRLLPFPDEPGPLVHGSPSVLLRAADRVVPFFGREQELERLTSWREAPDKVSVLLVHGPGGQGKTRLAVEFGRQSAVAGWCTLQALHEPDAEPNAGCSLGAADVLVVVDYAERWQRHHLTDLRRHVLARRPGRVRLLLVARHAGYWWKGLTNPLLKSGTTTFELSLGALADTVTQRRVAFAAARDRFAHLLGVTGAGRMRPAGSLDDDAYRLALTLHMAALAVVDAHARDATAPADPGALSAYLVRREQDHWQSMIDNGRITTRTEVMSRLVAIATLTRSLPPVDAEKVLIEVGLAGSPVEAQSMVDDHSLCYPPHGPRVLAPLLPDRLGEDFLAESLPNHEHGRGDPWVGRLPDALTTEAAAHAPAVLTVLIETAARWEHVRRDHVVPLLARRPGMVLRAEGAALITLASYADLPLLEALTAELPDRHVELDSGVAALSRKLADFALSRTDDEAAKARLYGSLAARLSNAGLYEDAVAAGWEALMLQRRLVEQTPDTHEPELANALGNIGIDLWHAGLLAESVAAMREAVDIYRRRAAYDPVAYDEDLAAELTNLTGALIGMGRFADALDPAREATATFVRLPGLDLERASAERNLAIVLGSLGRYAEAVPVIEAAVSVFRGLAREQPQVHIVDLADSLQTLGNQLAGANRHDEALAAAEQSVGLMRRLAAANPAAHERSLALSLTSLANRLSHRGDHSSAVAAGEEAVHIARRSAVPTPVLGVALNNLARHLARDGNNDTALATIQEAIAVWNALADIDPSTYGDRLIRALAIREELTRDLRQEGLP